MTSNEFASRARAHEHALRFAGALLETAARLAIVAVVLSAVAVRITIALAIRAVRLHAEPSARLYSA